MDPSTTLRELWDTTRLRLLVEIDRRGSVSAAARAIGIGQPTASQHLRLLETAAGRRLVERDGLGSFRREYPGVTVEVEVAGSAEILRRLLEGRVQLAIVGAQEADRRLTLEPFLEDEIIGVAKPGLLPLVDGTLE